MSEKDKSTPFDDFFKKHEDCDRPACKDTVSALQSAMNRLKTNESTKNMKLSTDSGSEKELNVECPPTSRLLGTSSWNLLHAMVCLSYIIDRKSVV